MTEQKTLQNRFIPVFSLDFRSMALYRVLLGIMLLADLAFRARYLRHHYTDWGFLPRDMFLDKFSSQWTISFHLMNGMEWFQALLFLVSAFFAIQFLIGYKTRRNSIICFILLTSLQMRNVHISSGADTLIRMMMFWSMFLPLGARFSVDAALDNNKEKRQGNTILTVGTVAYIIQILLIYWFTSGLKTGAEWRSEGTAIYYALNLSYMRTPIADFLLFFPGVMRVMTHITYWFEAVGPFLMLMPFKFGPFRTFAAFAFIGLHIGFGSCLKIGPFPFLNIISFTMFLPSWFWDKLLGVIWDGKRHMVKLYYDAGDAVAKKRAKLVGAFSGLPSGAVREADAIQLQEIKSKNSWISTSADGKTYTGYEAFLNVLKHSPLWKWLWWILDKPFLKAVAVTWSNNEEVKSGRRSFIAKLKEAPYRIKPTIAGTVIASIFIVYIVFHNFESFKTLDFKIPKQLKIIGYVTKVHQEWRMFAAFPSKLDGWHIVAGELNDGTKIDVFRGGTPLTFDKPENPSLLYPYFRIRKQMWGLNRSKNKRLRMAYLHTVCRDYNKAHDKPSQLKNVTLYVMKEFTKLNPAEEKVRKVQLAKRTCRQY